MDNFQYKRYKWPTAYSSFPTPPSRRGVSRACGHNLPVTPEQTSIVTRLTRDELLENEEALGHFPGWANIVLYFRYQTGSSDLLTSPAVGRDTAPTCIPQAKKEKNGGVGPKQPFHGLCIQMCFPRRLALIE
jgi:hypothetical protein